MANYAPLNAQMHDRYPSWLGTGIPLKSGRVELVAWDQAFHLSESMWQSQ